MDILFLHFRLFIVNDKWKIAVHISFSIFHCQWIMKWTVCTRTIPSPLGGHHLIRTTMQRSRVIHHNAYAHWWTVTITSLSCTGTACTPLFCGRICPDRAIITMSFVIYCPTAHCCALRPKQSQSLIQRIKSGRQVLPIGYKSCCQGNTRHTHHYNEYFATFAIVDKFNMRQIWTLQ